jgi:hypothetical protein
MVQTYWQRTHCLLDRRVIVEAMALKEVDVVELQAREAVLHRIEDVLAAESTLVGGARTLRLLGPVPRCIAKDLGHDDNLVPREGILLDRLAQDLLRHAVRVDRRRVECVDPRVVAIATKRVLTLRTRRNARKLDVFHANLQ